MENREKLIWVIACTLVFSVMNLGMFNVALPAVGEQFGLTPSQSGWVVSGFMILYAVGTVIYGKLADRYPLKRLLTFGLALLAAGSAVGLLSANFGMLIAARLIQAVGASVIPAISVIVPARMFPPETRGRAIGLTSAGLALGTAIGPIAAGMIATLLHWRFLFLLSLIPLLSLPFYRRYLETEAAKGGRTDLFGGVLFAAAVSALLVSLTAGDWKFAAAGALFLLCFLLRMVRVQDPFIDLQLLRNRRYALGLVTAGVGSGLAYGITYLMPLFLIEARQLTPLAGALIMFPGAALASLLGQSGGRLADRRGNTFLVYLALTLSFAGFLMIAAASSASPYAVMVILLISFVGSTFFQIAMGNTISMTLPREQTGVGMGLLMLSRFISGSCAVVLLSKALDAGAVYGRIYVMLAAATAAVGALYWMAFGARRPESP